MDFNDIKNTWKNSFETKELNQEEIIKRLELKSKSVSVLVKIKRNYIIESIFAIVVLAAIGQWLFNAVSLLEFFILFSILLLILSPLVIFMIKSFSNISVTKVNSAQIKESLLLIIDKIDRYVRFGTSNFYKFFVMPMSMVIGMLFAHYVASGETSFITSLTELGAKKIGGLFVAMIICGAILIPLSQLFAKKMYKRHLDELKVYLAELEEMDEDIPQVE